jgi:hypothetical protein
MWLVQSEGNQWSPGIGDPTFTGWLTVFCYFATAYQCYRAWKRAQQLGPNAYKLQLAWGSLALGMALLGLNKQLDLQSLVTVIARQHALDHGWYQERRILQGWVVRGMPVVGLAVAAWVTWYMRKHLKHFALAAAGAIFLGVFIVIRASSFHRVDVFLGAEALGVRFNALLELSGIACVWWNARSFRRKPLRQKGSG